MAVSFVNAEGTQVCKARDGERLLDVALRYGIDGLEGSCGGNMECGTCHVWLPSEMEAKPASETEEDILTALPGYDERRSRLACQITLKPALNQHSFVVPQNTK